MKENLIDDYHLRICAFEPGAGRLLFESTGRLDLHLVETKQYDSGLVLLKYLAANPSSNS